MLSARATLGHSEISSFVYVFVLRVAGRSFAFFVIVSAVQITRETCGRVAAQRRDGTTTGRCCCRGSIERKKQGYSHRHTHTDRHVESAREEHFVQPVSYLAPLIRTISPAAAVSISMAVSRH